MAHWIVGVFMLLASISSAAMPSIVRRSSSLRSADVPGQQNDMDMVRGASKEHPLSIIQKEISILCRTFPGTTCDSFIKGARRETVSHDNGLQLRAALRRKALSGMPFVFAAMGSSVTAGHDNHPNVSWPFELERILKPTFEKLGFGFEVRQRALGGYGSAPYSAGCLHNRAGKGVDVVSWDWNLFRDGKCVYHQYVREAYTLNDENQYAPVIFDMQQTSADMKFYRNEEVIPDQATAITVRQKLFKNNDIDDHLDQRKWHPSTWYLTEQFISKDEMDMWKEVNAGRRKVRDLGPFSLAEGGIQRITQNEMKPTAQQQAEIDRLNKESIYGKFSDTLIQRAKALDGVKEAGFGYEAFYAGAGLSKVAPEYQSWYAAHERVFMVNWHPGPLGHLLIATQVAHYLLSELSLALKHSEEPAPALPRLPASTSPECGLSRFCATGVRPHSGQDIRDIVADQANWTQAVSINQAHADQSFDSKVPLIGKVNDGELKLKVQAHRPGDVALLCMAPCGWRCDKHQGILLASQYVRNKSSFPVNIEVMEPKADVEYRLDGKLVSDDALVTMNGALFDKKTGSFCPGCDDVEHMCQGVAELSGRGPQLLSLQVRPRQQDNDPETTVELLQVMVVPGPNSKKD